MFHFYLAGGRKRKRKETLTPRLYDIPVIFSPTYGKPVAEAVIIGEEKLEAIENQHDEKIIHDLDKSANKTNKFSNRSQFVEDSVPNFNDEIGMTSTPKPVANASSSLVDR